MTVAAGQQFEAYIQEEKPEFQEWVADQDLNQKEKTIWLFHRWLRQETDLTSGSIVDYRRYVNRYLDEDGVMEAEQGELTSHERAAVNKFTEFKQSSYLAKKSGEE